MQGTRTNREEMLITGCGCSSSTKTSRGVRSARKLAQAQAECSVTTTDIYRLDRVVLLLFKATKDNKYRELNKQLAGWRRQEECVDKEVFSEVEKLINNEYTEYFTKKG